MREKSLVLKEKILAGFQNKAWVKQLISSSEMPLTLKMNVHDERRVYLVLDCSTSMSWKGKMQQAREGSIGFALEAQDKGYSVGLISFSSEAHHLLEPCNPARIMAAVGMLKAKGSTNMADAIIMAVEMLSGMSGERVMCIVSDGKPDSDEETLEAAENAKGMGIDIMCIGTDDADEEFLEKLATRKELSVKVEVSQFQQGMIRMAGLLPDRSREESRR